jgi:CII-binding regulator of phage lambda lysogenization HflD
MNDLLKLQQLVNDSKLTALERNDYNQSLVNLQNRINRDEAKINQLEAKIKQLESNANKS